MWRDLVQLIRPKHAAFLALSLVLLAYLSVRSDTTSADMVFGGCLVAALWILTGARAYMRLGERRETDRGNPHAR